MDKIKDVLGKIWLFLKTVFYKIIEIFNVTISFIKKMYYKVKTFIKEKLIPFVKRIIEGIKVIIKEKVIPFTKNTIDRVKIFVKKDLSFFLYKVYCRIFQFGMKMLLPFMPYRKPTILNNNIDLVNVLKSNKINNVLIVTDEGIVKAGLLLKLTMSLDEGQINYTVYDKTVPNPTMTNVEEAKELYVSNCLEGIIALGGGSSLDLSKVVGARVVNPNKSVKKMAGLLKVRKKLPFLVAIPTTSGTGSEVTVAAVITNEFTHHKFVINDFSLIPQYAVLDYANTINLPPFITATTGMDAFTHAIEAYIGKSRTFEKKKMSIVASKLIVKNLKKVYKNPKNYEARNNMLYASYYAGVAFTKAYVGYVHAIAHTLGGKYNIPHGLANAVVLPIVLEEYGECIYKKIKKIAFESLIVSYKDSEKEATRKFIKWIYDTNRELGIPKYFKEIKEEDIDELVALAIKEANPLYPVPKIMNNEDLKRIYLRIRGN